MKKKDVLFTIGGVCLACSLTLHAPTSLTVLLALSGAAFFSIPCATRWLNRRPANDA